jgi:tetratricopeptide (TPR) repeat protein
VKQIAGMDADDPYRVALLHDVRQLFSADEEGEARNLMRWVESASEATAQSRLAFSESFHGQLNPTSINDFLSLLLRSGRNNDAIDFGLAAVHHPEMNTYPKTMQLLTDALTRRGHAEQAARLIDQHLGRRVFPDAEFYQSWCETLRLSERWDNLWWIAERMRESEEGDTKVRELATYYMGLAQYKLGNFPAARGALSLCTHPETAQAYPGMLAEAWRMLAETNRLEDRVFSEKQALRAALELEPDNDGDRWLRLSTLISQSEDNSFSAAERALAHAIRLNPARAEELMPKWREMGDAALRTDGVQLDFLRRELRERKLYTPRVSSGPFELFRLAEIYTAEREWVGVSQTCRRLLSDYKGLVPALDMYIDACFELSDYQTAAGLLIDRMESMGPDKRGLRLLDRLPPGTLTGPQKLRVMQLDPSYTGRLAVADALRKDGRFEKALSGLLALSLDELGPEGRILAGELMLATGRSADALRVLRDIPRGHEDYAAALALRIRCGLEVGDTDRLDKLIAEPTRPEHIDFDRMLALTDELLLGQHAEQGARLLQTLDQFPETRGLDVLLRLAMANMLLNRPVAALESLDRAEAFEGSSAPILGRVLMAIQSGSYGTLPLDMNDLIESEQDWSPLKRVAVTLLDERLDVAQRLIDAVDSSDPLFVLLGHARQVLQAEKVVPSDSLGSKITRETLAALNGMGVGRRDPRGLLAYIAAIESPPWTVWAVASLRAESFRSGAELWPAYLIARGLARLGQPARALSELRSIIEQWPTFAPAWDLLEQLELERLGRIDHIDLVRLRSRRRSVLGPREGEEAEILLSEAWRDELNGNLAQAARAAREAADADPDFLAAHFKLAQLNAQRGKYDAAIEAYRTAMAIAPHDALLEIAQELLDVLEKAHQSDPELFPRALILAEQENLRRHADSDPLVALAQAREDLRTEGLSPALGVARAYERLDGFRERTGHKAIEDLRPGCTKLWKEFYSRLDPKRAEAFVRGELELHPGSLELWTMLAETYEAQERYREAVEMYTSVQNMVPDAAGRRRLAWLKAELASPHADVLAEIQSARELEPESALDPFFDFVTARSLFNGNDADRTNALLLLGKLWSSRAEVDPAQGSSASTLDSIQLGRMYGSFLVQRADPADRELAADVLDQTAAAMKAGAARDVTKALAQLGRLIPIRPGSFRE